jgi:hypothetical protein
MPALVNINVGSLRGTNGEDDTISWPFSAKKFRKVDLISLTPLMFIQSGVLGPAIRHPNRAFGLISAGQSAFRQGQLRCPETVQGDQ